MIAGSSQPQQIKPASQVAVEFSLLDETANELKVRLDILYKVLAPVLRQEPTPPNSDSLLKAEPPPVPLAQQIRTTKNVVVDCLGVVNSIIHTIEL